MTITSAMINAAADAFASDWYMRGPTDMYRRIADLRRGSPDSFNHAIKFALEAAEAERAKAERVTTYEESVAARGVPRLP